MNANVLKSKSLFCLDASYAPLHTVGGGACARKRIKGWDIRGLLFSLVCTSVHCRLTTHLLVLLSQPALSLSLPPPSHPPRSVFFVKFVPAVLTVASARYREPLALFARKASSLLDAGCIFYVAWFPWGSLFDFLLNKQMCITRDWKKSVERKRAFVFETLIVEIGDFHYR